MNHDHCKKKIRILVYCFALAVAFCFSGCDQNTYPNADRLVSAAWVKTLIDENNNGNPYIIAETSWGGPEGKYDKGHIPGAIHVNTDEIEYDEFKARNGLGDNESLGRSTTEAQDLTKGLTADGTLPRNWWNLYPDEYLIPALAAMGIDIDTTVVVYSHSMSAAARLVWTLMYAGVKDVRLLDGGYDAWVNAGYAVSTETTQRTPASDFGTNTPLNAKYLVDIAYVRQVANGEKPDALMVDIREYDEYTGKTAPYSYIPTSGRVKGAVWGYDSDDLLNEDGTLKSLDIIEDMWEAKGITSDKALSFYCGTAWRSSLAWFCAYMMGWKNISNFDSSWYEWSMGPEADQNPVVDEFPELP